MELPEGWESDYDGERWFYRFKPNGLTQFQFPQPGDEFPNFVGANVELEPEERLASERQLRKRNTLGSDNPGYTKRSGSGRKKVVENTGKDEFVMSATGYFDPSSFMYFGSDDQDNTDITDNEDNEEKDVTKSKEDEELPGSAADSAQSPGFTPSTIKSEIVTGQSVVADDSIEATNPVVELSCDNDRKQSPIGLVAELAGPHTAKCAEELAPIELDAVSSVSPTADAISTRSEVAELSAENHPVERKPPPPQPPPAPMQPVDSYPLVSASFAYPPLRTAGNRSTGTPGKVENAQVRKQPDAPKEKPLSANETQAKYQPSTLEQRVSRDATRVSQRSSMILSNTSVLQSQNNELGTVDLITSQKSVPEYMNNRLEKPKMFVPPVDRRQMQAQASITPPKIEEPSTSVPQALHVLHKIPLEDSSSNHPPEQSRLPPLPGSGARHGSITAYPRQAIEVVTMPQLAHPPSIMQPAHRLSTTSFPEPQQLACRKTSPARYGGIPQASLDRVETRSQDSVIYRVTDSEHSITHHSLEFAPVAPLKPRKSPSPERVAPANFSRPQLPHSSRSMPDTLDQITNVISELSSIMPLQGDVRPKLDASTIQRANGRSRSPSTYQIESQQNSVSSTAPATAFSVMPTPPSVSSAQSQRPPSLEVSPRHTLDINRQRSSAEPSGQKSNSVATIETHNRTPTWEGPQGPYSVSDAITSHRSPFYIRTNTRPISSNEIDQGQTCPSCLSFSSMQPSGQESNSDFQGSSSRSTPKFIDASRSSSQVSSNSGQNMQVNRYSTTPSIAKESIGDYNWPQPLAELPSHESGIPSSIVSQVSSPARSVASLYRASLAASPHLQTRSDIESRPTSIISQSVSLSAHQVIHELPATSVKPSSPSTTAENMPTRKPKPFPMLPGQVTPMPSQMGSSPVPLPAQLALNGSAKSHSTPSTPSNIVHPLSQAGPRPASLEISLTTSQGQQFAERLPHLQMKPGQQMVDQGQPHPSGQGLGQPPWTNLNTTPAQHGNRGSLGFHTGPIVMRPPSLMQQPPPQYPSSGSHSNGAAVASDKGKGMKKWAKKIFQTSSSKQNAAAVGIPAGGAPPNAGDSAAASRTHYHPSPTLALENASPVNPAPYSQAPPRAPGHPGVIGGVVSSKLVADRTTNRPVSTGSTAAVMNPNAARAASGSNGWQAKAVDYSGGDWGHGW